MPYAYAPMPLRRQLKAASRAGAKRAAWPLRRLLDPRFAETNSRVQWAQRVVLDEEIATRAVVGERIDRYSVANEESLLFIGTELQGVREQVEAVSRSVGDMAAQTFDSVYESRIERILRAPVDELDAASARLLNHGESHKGFAAQRGLWLNPAVSLEHRVGDVVPGDVNERIVEIPYALSALGTRPPGARVLDVGSAESLIALHCASLGYETVALDLRPYPFAHPNLEVVVSKLEEWDAGDRSFDAILCISTLEHVGLGWYGETQEDEGADRRALDRLGAMLAPDGFVVLTVPYGTAGVDAVQRTYDGRALDALFDGWSVQDRRIVTQADRNTWLPARDGLVEGTGRAVAMVTARPAGAA
ncbi:MAG: hypothetical protein AVDCRST_MAG69-409 [uncultured Solirubrobacteraceae bacterium]|uniref:Methyltransferase type 11 domain-containing protein n=1 Tax=uncultured Solirubrobacteraceae bacterium TaxID=1162706 RepID=A0A6J4RTJ0_9ACTN|nr:MAG: hypothetical protein AVDCRST_MAG69-409 [uncultured Solirubrobacteraceae bacterium]